MIKNIKMPVLLTMLAITLLCPAVNADNDYMTGTRGEGIGFSYSALAEEPTGALYNPAGPAFIKGWQAQFQFQRPTEYGLSVLNESPYGGLMGANYYHEKLGNIVLNAHQFGSFTDPTSLTTVSSVNLSYARLINEQWAAGAGFKYMFESNFGDRSVYDLDMGLTWRPTMQASLALVGENLLKSELTPEITGFPQHLSRKFRLAGAYHTPLKNASGSFLAGWQLEQAGEIETNNTSLFNLGTEWWLNTQGTASFGVRGGYTFGKTTAYSSEEDYARWSAGLSVNFNVQGRDFRIDYAVRSYPYESTEDLAADHFVSFCYGWGGVPDYYSEQKDDTYDLAKYRQEQTWKTPTIARQIARPEQVEQPDSPNEVSRAKSPDFDKLNLVLDATQLSSAGNPKIVFYLRPDGFLKINSWKLYIFSAKLKKWQDDAVDDFALHIIDGKGVTPLNIVWNGQQANGEMVMPGKYYFVVIGQDNYGQRYMSKWQKFKVE